MPKRGPSWAIIIDAFDQLRHYGSEDVELEDLPDDLEELTRLRGELTEWKRAVSEVISQVDRRIRVDLGAKGYAVFGPQYFRVTPDTKLSLKPEKGNEWWHMVEEHLMARRLFNPNDARSSGIKELSELPNPETGELLTYDQFLDYFYNEKGGEQLSLIVMPTDRAPQWVQKLADGTIRRPTREETDEPEPADS